MPRPPLLNFWLADIRKAALIACVAMVLGVLIPAWDGARTMLAIESMRQWSVPVIVLTWCFTAIMPVFYFALYRNKGLPDFPKSLRLLSLTAAIVLGAITVAGLPQWIESIGSYWADIKVFDWSAGAVTVLDAAQEPGTSKQAAALLGTFSDLAYIGLLIAFFRHERKESPENNSVSKLLSVATKIAVIAGGLVVAGCLVRLPVMPYVYVELRDHAMEVGLKPPRLGTIMVDAVRTLLIQACFYTAPYVVYRSRARRPEAPEHAMSTL